MQLQGKSIFHGSELIRWYEHHPDDTQTTRHEREDEQMKLRWSNLPEHTCLPTRMSPRIFQIVRPTWEN